MRLLSGHDKHPEYVKVDRTGYGTGSQHAKSLHCDVGSVVGSTNFWTSSLCNHEVSSHVTLTLAASASWRYELMALIQSGSALGPAEIAHDIARSQPYRRARSQSVDPSRRRLRSPGRGVDEVGV